MPAASVAAVTNDRSDFTEQSGEINDDTDHTEIEVTDTGETEIGETDIGDEVDLALEAEGPANPDLYRRRKSAAGGVLYAAMFGIEQVLGRKPKEEAPIVVDAPTEPVDIETDGVVVAIDDQVSAWAPPQPRVDPLAPRPRRTSRNR